MTKHIYSAEQLTQMDSCAWLTPREREVFDRKYKKDESVVQIADALFISPRTVDYTLHSIKVKTGMIRS